jgi:hypothetical protein
MLSWQWKVVDCTVELDTALHWEQDLDLELR